MKNYYFLLPLLLLFSIKSKAQEEKTIFTGAGLEISIKEGNKKKEINENTVFQIKEVDKAPEFKGGIEAFRKKINQKIWIPASVKVAGNPIVITYSFIIEKDGTISNITPIITGYYNCSPEVIKNEAFKAIKKLPKWTPAEIDNKPVRTKTAVSVNVK